MHILGSIKLVLPNEIQLLETTNITLAKELGCLLHYSKTNRIVSII